VRGRGARARAAPLRAHARPSRPAPDYSFPCGKTAWTLAEAQALGVDVGSVVVPSPSVASNVAAGRALLEM
jgi:hypothetical protein